MTKGKAKKELADFLKRLYRGCNPASYLEIRMITRGKVRAKFIPLVDVIEEEPGLNLEDVLAENRKGYNIYFGVNPRIEKAGRKDSVKEVVGLWADIDAKDFKGGKAEALETIQQRIPGDFEPSYIIDTGHGYHVYWLFEEPVSAKNGTIIEEANGRIAKYLGGDKVGDLPRILRLPGTYNTKSDLVVCEIIASSPRRYRVADLHTWTQTFALGEEEAAAKAEDSVYAAGDGEYAGLPESKEKWLTQALWGVGKGKRNKTCAKLAGYFLEKVPPDVAQVILQTWATRCSPPMEQSEVDTTVRSIARRVSVKQKSQTNENDGGDEIASLKIVKTEPPYYLAETGSGITFALPVEAMTSFYQFRKAYVAAVNRFPVFVTNKTFPTYIDELLANATIEEAPDDASEDESIYQMIYDHVNSEKEAISSADFKAGNVVFRDGEVFFASQPIWEHLRGLQFKIKKHDLYRIMRRHGCRHQIISVGGQTVNAWVLKNVPYTITQKISEK